ncbi:MAG: thiamine-phosphate kinase [Thermodesulfovibrionales bacterium]|jgi:thiamine-monophosphate kinase
MSGRKLLQRGEVSLLRDVRKRFDYKDSGIIRGIGDDAAVLAPLQENILVTTDMMNEGVHFDLSFSSPFHLGFKLVSVNVSDIYAMGGRPLYVFLDLGLKADTDEPFLWDLYDGLSSAMELYGVKLLGGDLCGVRTDMVISATLMGAAGSAVLRSGASAGDRIYVTGSLGDSACGLEILKRLAPEELEKVRARRWDKAEPELLSSETHGMSRDISSPLLKRHLMPTARDSSLIGKHATSLIDISDGLFIDLLRVCDESGVGAMIRSKELPLSREMTQAAAEMGLDPFRLATSGGEDYELLFTLPREIPAAELGIAATCIGEITSEARAFVDEKGERHPLRGEGYQHFGDQG